MENDEKVMIECIKNKDVDGFNAAQASYNQKAKVFIKEASGKYYWIDLIKKKKFLFIYTTTLISNTLINNK